MKSEKIELCLQIIAGRKTRTEMSTKDFALLFNKSNKFPDQNEILDAAIYEITALFVNIQENVERKF
jgi:hypothetical protein